MTLMMWQQRSYSYVQASQSLYKYLLPYLEDDHRSYLPWTPHPSPSSNPGWFPRSYVNYHHHLPPHYSKYLDNSTGSTGAGLGGQDGLGFWSGAGLGSLGTYLLTHQHYQELQQRCYDWENKPFQWHDPVLQGPQASGSFSQQPSCSCNRAGSSNMGATQPILTLSNKWASLLAPFFCVLTSAPCEFNSWWLPDEKNCGPSNIIADVSLTSLFSLHEQLTCHRFTSGSCWL